MPLGHFRYALDRLPRRLIEDFSREPGSQRINRLKHRQLAAIFRGQIQKLRGATEKLSGKIDVSVGRPDLADVRMPVGAAIGDRECARAPLVADVDLIPA